MPIAGTTYTLPAVYQVTTGEDGLPEQHNTPLEDIETALTTMLGTIDEGTYKIGDYLTTRRAPGSDWLQRDGSIYAISSYPTLGALFDPLPNGIQWTSVTSPWGANSVSGADINTGTGVIVASVGNTAYRSTDGSTWSTVALPFSTGGTDSVRYGGGRWVIFRSGQTTVSTDDGLTWSTPTTASMGEVQTGPIIYGNGVFAVSHSALGGTSPKVSTSTDGVTWTDRLTGTELHYTLTFDGTNLVSYRNDGYIYTSPDGVTWTQVTPNTTISTPYGAITDDQETIIVGGSGSIYETNLNYTTLNSRTSGTSETLYDVVRFGDYYVAVGTAGACVISSDGTTWTASSTGVSSIIYKLIVNTNTVNQILAMGAGTLLRGVQTSSSQFQVPDDDPDYGYIRAT